MIVKVWAFITILFVTGCVKRTPVTAQKMSDNERQCRAAGGGASCDCKGQGQPSAVGRTWPMYCFYNTEPIGPTGTLGRIK